MKQVSMEQIVYVLESTTTALKLMSKQLNQLEDRHDKILDHLIEAMSHLNEKINEKKDSE